MKYEIPVFRAERDAGLEHAVRTKASVAYLTPIEVIGQQDSMISEEVRKLASAAIGSVPDNHDDEELFYMKDVLVTSGWNLNDDVFDKLETWSARHSPKDKPLNFNHDQRDIIGHIVASQAVNDEMVPLAEDIPVDDLPDKFHIVNGSVIYRHIGDKERRAFVEATISEIVANKWYVSMEALFRGFDYAVKGPDGEQGVIPRNEQSAWLTKYLRAYPPDKENRMADPAWGSGSYTNHETGEVYRLGRLMRNITFCGKGLVSDPGNPESIIFSNVASFKPTQNKSVYVIPTEVSANSNNEVNLMAETNSDLIKLQSQVDELIKSNQLLITDKKNLSEEIASLRNKDVDAKIASLEATLATQTTSIASLNTQLETVKSALFEQTSKTVEAERVRDEAVAELSIIRAEKSQADRKALLKEKNASEATQAKLLESLKTLDDTAFVTTVEALAPSWASVVTPSTPRPVSSVSDALDRAKVESDATLAISSTVETEREAAQAVIHSFFETSVFKASPKVTQ